jgi:hypothetical protein
LSIQRIQLHNSRKAAIQTNKFLSVAAKMNWKMDKQNKHVKSSIKIEEFIPQRKLVE